MNILYVTRYVLGDSGANAAELFPKFAAASHWTNNVIVADFAENEKFVRDVQKAKFLCLRKGRSLIRESLSSAREIVRAAIDHDIDIIHVFYRERNVPLVSILRILLMWRGSKAILITDHRSVNLSRGFPSLRKKLINIASALASHQLVGNPLAVESNQFLPSRRHRIVDLGYDDTAVASIADQLSLDLKIAAVDAWFVGSLKPKNRKSWFLIEFMRTFAELFGPNEVVFNVAGPADNEQIEALSAIPGVNYLGVLSRTELYTQMRDRPGIGLAFMNREFHDLAPSLKFVEYALFGYRVLASSTVGLRMQAARMGFDDVTFVDESVDAWCQSIASAARDYRMRGPANWTGGDKWSYQSIFDRQVRSLYVELKGYRAETTAAANDMTPQT